MGLDNLLHREDDTDYTLPFREATVLRSELRHCADSLEEKVHRMKYYEEAPSLAWLTELSEDLSRMLRNAREK